MLNVYAKITQSLLFCLCLLAFGSVKAQNLHETRWYYGNSTNWVQFDPNNNFSAINQTGQVTTYGSNGSAVATDFETGNVLFYTDGAQLVKPDNTTLALTGDPTKVNPAIIVPKPGSPDEFYIFVNTATNVLEYYTYNVQTQTLASATPTPTGITSAAPAMQLVRQQNEFAFWLFVQNRNTNTLSRIRISEAGGVSAPQQETLTGLPNFTANAFAYSPDLNLLAIGTTVANDMEVKLFGVNPTTGAIVQPEFASLPGTITTNGNISGLAFAGDYLYVSQQNDATAGTNQLSRFDVTQATPTEEVINTRPNVFDVKLGPDGNIYHLYDNGNGSFVVQRVNNPTAAIVATPTLPFGGVNFNGTHFPQVAPPAFRDFNIEFDVAGLCLGNPTYFYPRFIDEAPDSVTWEFGDGTNGSGFQAIHLYEDQMTQTYTVNMRAFYPGGNVEVRTKTINLQQAPTIQLQPEYILCQDTKDSTLTVQIQDAQGNDVASQYTITWFKPLTVDSVGKPVVETKDSIEVSAMKADRLRNGAYPEAGTYYVIAEPKSGAGCALSASTVVVVYESEFQKTNTWYFGNGAGINFNEQPPVSVDQSQMEGGNEAIEGTALYADDNADVMLYTNGETIWFRDSDGDGIDEIATNGTNIGGSRTSTQSSLIIPFENDPTLFYIFTTNDNTKQMSYTVADFKGQNVVVAQDVFGELIKNRVILEPSTEKLVAIENTNGGRWVVGHELNSNRFFSFPVTADGIGNPIITSAGSVISETNSEGYMRFNEDGTLLAVALPGAGNNVVEIFRFDADSGAVLNEFVSIPLTGASGTAYGLEFAGNRLYVTTTNKNGGGNSQLYQFTVDSVLNAQNIIASKVLISDVTDTYGAVQLAPDQQLYLAVNNAVRLPTFAAPTDSAATADGTIRQLLTDQSPDLSPNNSRLGLPNFILQTGRSIPDGTVFASNACYGEDVLLSGTRRYNNESYLFVISQNGTERLRIGPTETADTTFNTAALMIDPGSYTVNLFLVSECGTFPDYNAGEEPIEASFEVFPQPEIVIPGETTKNLCQDQQVSFEAFANEGGTNSADTSKYAFVWIDATSGAVVVNSNSVFTQANKLTTSVGGAWGVFLYNKATGCNSDTLYVEALDQRPEARLQDDFGLCAGGNPVSPSELNIQSLPSDVIDYNINWFYTLNNGPRLTATGGTSLNLQNIINPRNPGEYKIWFEMVPKSTGSTLCPKIDTVNILVAAKPRVTINPTNNNCSGSTQLNASVEGGSNDISYFWSGPDAPTGTEDSTITATATGWYRVNITDNFTGCTAVSDSIYIDVFNGLQDIRVEMERCSPMLVKALTSYTGGDRMFIWFDENGTELTRSNSNQKFLSSGNYQVVVTTTNTNCTASSDTLAFTVQETVIPRDKLLSVYTICPSIPELAMDTIRLSGYNRYRWIDKSNGQVLSQDSAFVVFRPGQYQVFVDQCNIPVSFSVEEDCTPELFLPNVFRIGGRNRVFKILNENMLANLKDFQILIFNRWGEVIYQSNNPAFEWDGSSKGGREAIVGTYPYLIRYRNMYGNDQSLKELKGGVTVLK